MSLAHTMLAALGIAAFAMAQPVQAQGASVHAVKMNDIDGRPVDLSRYKGKVLLIINVASECGYTGQYAGLQKLHAKLGKEGLVVLGVPCNDFGNQEPGTEAQIKDFARKNYGVQFELFSKVAIDGTKPCPLYQLLTSSKTNPVCAGPVRWNFEKFLIGRDGRVVARFAADVEPESDEMLNRIRQELEKK